jgi:GTP cyclohydrolase I
MRASPIMTMNDIQNQKDHRKINITKVGVKGIKYPIIVLDRAKGTQPVNAAINMYVSLPHHFKGTHMSRFVEILNEFRGQINIKTFHTILEKVREKLRAESAHMEIDFPYFIEKEAPVSKAKSLMEYRCSFCGHNDGKKSDFLVGVVVPVTTVCPCSREISDMGAHNQRSMVSVKTSSVSSRIPPAARFIPCSSGRMRNLSQKRDMKTPCSSKTSCAM